MLCYVLEVGMDGLIRPVYGSYKRGVVKLSKRYYKVGKGDFMACKVLFGLFTVSCVLVDRSSFLPYRFAPGRREEKKAPEVAHERLTAEEFGILLQNTSLSLVNLMKTEGDKLQSVNMILLFVILGLIVMSML